MIEELFKSLHSHPELSGQENITKKTLIEFLKKNTSLEIIELAGGFYAAHREALTDKPSIALRADYDALALPEGGAAHICGHDGHAAVLCGVALALNGETVGRNVFLLFQSAEETGAGAKNCLSIFKREKVDEIYGAHNLPGYPLGQVLTKPGTFACGSVGYIIELSGKPTHAAYPENGISPAHAVGRLLSLLPEIADRSLYSGMVLCTVIGINMGEKAFGAAAANAEIWLTLRAEHEVDLIKLKDRVADTVKRLASEDELGLKIEEQDAFPATENDSKCASYIMNVCSGALLEEPMRWSEDFGHYLMNCKGAFFGIGAGLKQPPLHTAEYVYPVELLKPSIDAFMQIIY